MKQGSLLATATNGRMVRADKFLEEMDKVIPWGRLLGILCPKYYKENKTVGRKRTDLERLLRIYFLQQWYQLSDLSAEEQAHDRLSFRRFLSMDICDDTIDETTICKFRHFLETNELTKKMFSEVDALLKERGLIIRDGTSVDATIIKASSSTKNKDKKRDEEMSSTKKGNQYHFGMKFHTGVDSRSKLIHTVKTTTAKVHDSQMFDELLHGEEKSVFGDSAYINKEKKTEFRQQGKYWGFVERATRWKKLSAKQKKRNHKNSSVRAGVEHPFHTIKHLWKYKQVRYKGLMKNTAQIFSLCFLANLYRVRTVFQT